MNFSGIKNIIKLLFIIPFLIGIWSIVLIQLGLINVNVDLTDRDDMLEAYQKAEQANRDNTLAAYQKEAQLDPDNADGWNELGRALLRTGELAQAEEAFRKVLALGEAHQNQDEQTWALGNLGNVYFTRGEMDKAEEMYRKVLSIHETLGSKGGMAATYGNLGSVYFTRGDLDKAEDLWKKSLRLFQEIGHPSAKEFQLWLDKLAQQRTISTQ